VGCWTTVIRSWQLLATTPFFIVSLPPIHKDPFDRILVAQATVEGITLLTADALVA
jgi:Uncharacterized protein conserved in bacteria